MSSEIQVTHKQTELKVFDVSLIGRHSYKDLAVSAVTKALDDAGYLALHEDSAPSKLATSLDVFVSIPEDAKLPGNDRPRVTITTGTCPGVCGLSQPENDKLLFIEFQYNEAFDDLLYDQKNDWFSNAITQAVRNFVKPVTAPKPTNSGTELQAMEPVLDVITACYWAAKHKETLNKSGIQVHAVKDLSIFTGIDCFNALKFDTVLGEIAKVWPESTVVQVRDHFGSGLLVQIPGQEWALYLQ